MAMCSYDCAAQPKSIEPYGDIAGIGVTLAFLINAWMIVALLCVYYIAVYNPCLDPFRSKTRKNARCKDSDPNTADCAIVNLLINIPFLAKLRVAETRQTVRLEATLNKCVLILTDIQIFTGLAVLISGYKELTCGLSSYHWQLIVHLGWLASVTHLSTLSFLRKHFLNHPKQLYWRSAAAIPLILLVIVAAGLAGHFDWEDTPHDALLKHPRKSRNSPADYAVCFLNHLPAAYSPGFEAMVMSIFLLTYGYMIRLAKLSKRFDSFSKRIAAVLLKQSHNHVVDSNQGDISWAPMNAATTSQRCMLILVVPFVTAFCQLVRTHLDIVTSFFAEVCWLLNVAAWGTLRLLKLRHYGPKEEDEWTFGQILPLIILIAPVAQMVEYAWHPSSRENRAYSNCTCVSDSIIPTDPPDIEEAGTETKSSKEVIGKDLKPRPEPFSTHRRLLIASLPYMEASYQFLQTNTKGPFSKQLMLAFSFGGFGPLVFTLWIFCRLFASTLSCSDETRVLVEDIIFSALCMLCLQEFLVSVDVLYSLETSFYLVMSIFSIYLLILALFIANHYILPSMRINTHGTEQIVAGILVGGCISTWYYTRRLIWSPEAFKEYYGPSEIVKTHAFVAACLFSWVGLHIALKYMRKRIMSPWFSKVPRTVLTLVMIAMVILLHIVTRQDYKLSESTRLVTSFGTFGGLLLLGWKPLQRVLA